MTKRRCSISMPMESNEMTSVMIIDDDPRASRVIVEGLRLAGYQVSDAREGRDAIGQLSTSHLDVVITDILMPEMDGLEVIIWLKKKQPHLKVVALSGGPELHLKNATLLGADCVIKKPIRIPELVGAIEGVLHEENCSSNG